MVSRSEAFQSSCANRPWYHVLFRRVALISIEPPVGYPSRKLATSCQFWLPELSCCRVNAPLLVPWYSPAIRPAFAPNSWYRRTS